jgi:hypothetical protein
MLKNLIKIQVSKINSGRAEIFIGTITELHREGTEFHRVNTPFLCGSQCLLSGPLCNKKKAKLGRVEGIYRGQVLIILSFFIIIFATCYGMVYPGR